MGQKVKTIHKYIDFGGRNVLTFQIPDLPSGRRFWVIQQIVQWFGHYVHETALWIGSKTEKFFEVLGEVTSVFFQFLFLLITWVLVSPLLLSKKLIQLYWGWKDYEFEREDANPYNMSAAKQPDAKDYDILPNGFTRMFMRELYQDRDLYGLEEFTWEKAIQNRVYVEFVKEFLQDKLESGEPVEWDPDQHLMESTMHDILRAEELRSGRLNSLEEYMPNGFTLSELASLEKEMKAFHLLPSDKLDIGDEDFPEKGVEILEGFLETAHKYMPERSIENFERLIRILKDGPDIEKLNYDLKSIKEKHGLLAPTEWVHDYDKLDEVLVARAKWKLKLDAEDPEMDYLDLKGRIELKGALNRHLKGEGDMEPQRDVEIAAVRELVAKHSLISEDELASMPEAEMADKACNAAEERLQNGRPGAQLRADLKLLISIVNKMDEED